MKKGDKVSLKIEKLVYEGAGLGKIDGFSFFVENTCPEDVVEAEITVVNKHFARAKLIEIKEPSPHRVKPFCPIHNACGGCGWQFIDYDFQLEQKRNIVAETVKKLAGREIEVKPVIKSPKTREFRSKVQYPVAQTKVSKRLLAGYYKKGTHELINVKFCPIQPNITGKIVNFAKEAAQELGISGYNEKTHKGELRHIVIRYSMEKNECLVIFAVNDTKLSEKFKKLAEKLTKEFAHIKGVCINYNTAKTNVILSNDTRCICGNRFYFEKIGEIEYKISANSFFQVNTGTAKNIFDTVKEIIEKNYPQSLVLDAYSGVSSFGVYLKESAAKIVSVEECKSASEDALENARLNNAQNMEILNGDAKKIFENLINEGRSFDITLLDPPRKGCEKESLDFAAALTKKAIIYVSCNPATLARDIKYLEENGFRATYIQPFDMFCHSYHIESLCLLEKG